MPLTLLEAISREEGFGIPGKRATRNNNPCDLEFKPWETAFDAVLETIPAGYEEEPRFACFPTPEAGFAAARALLTKDYLGLTIQQFVAKFAPSSENNVQAYVAALCEMCGVTAETVVTAELVG